MIQGTVVGPTSGALGVGHHALGYSDLGRLGRDAVSALSDGGPECV